MKSILFKKQKGFTVLFSVIVSAIVLAIGISIANITLKQIIISSAGRESQIAFYAADSGAECAMYYDLKNTDIFNLISAPSSDSISCFNNTAEDSIDFDRPIDGSAATTTFTIYFKDLTSGNQTQLCAKVSVGKHDFNSDGIADKTIIESRGYNVCDSGNPRQLERGLEITY